VSVEIAPGDTWMLEGDEAQLRQVIWNLASNGLRAMPAGGALRLGLERGSPGLVSLSVADEGVGIPADRIDAIFQPFSSSFESGTGLGLAIVHRIVSDSGGSIVVTSQPGKGTTMRVDLPAIAPAGDEARPPEAGASGDGSPAVGRVA
jgi:signal transduction histidine kinase